MRLYDAHNHLQDERFSGRQRELLATAKAAGVAAMVVNGSSEEDWGDVAALSREDPIILPSFGVHPWYHGTRSPHWLGRLRELLVQDPRAGVGEIGLDRWKDGLSYAGQEETFLAQWRLASELNRPASIHCLKAWGRLHELLRENRGPARGFVLHSYGGPGEMVEAFAKLGAYFSFPGYYLHPRKEKQRESFRRVPLNRLLAETDAPDQGLPDELNQYPLAGPDGQAINHPANLRAIYQGLSETLGLSAADLSAQLEENFHRVFCAPG